MTEAQKSWYDLYLKKYIFELLPRRQNIICLTLRKHEWLASSKMVAIFFNSGLKLNKNLTHAHLNKNQTFLGVGFKTHQCCHLLIEIEIYIEENF